ncbi:MAG: glycosyltransferase family 25 protein [Thermoguttaceae bacterium]|nr:glycosyltransferase family 25 protein [Thermoguttaceae bacterium]
MLDNDVCCYVINRDQDVERWEAIRRGFEVIGMTPTRFSAILGKEHLDSPLYSPRGYLLAYGREAMPAEIGCYLSHLKVWELFLASDKKYALVCEDDVTPVPEFCSILEEAIKYQSSWDLLRLVGSRKKSSITYRTLTSDFRLCTTITGMVITAGYVINRKAAERLILKLNRIVLPVDAAMFQGLFGVREASILPYLTPFNENAKLSTIQQAIPEGRITQLRWWTCRLHRLYVRFHRYPLQLFRVIRRLYS